MPLRFFVMGRLFVRSAPAGRVEIPEPGVLIGGKYRVQRVLGGGGMGVVLAAHHELLDQRVAVKIMTARDKSGVSRFLREARSTACLNSAHVARVMDVGSLGCGAPFIVMEYLDGCDLERLLHRGGRLPVRDAVGYVLEALEGLAQAHAVGIVHRDIKPANLFLAIQPGGSKVIKIVDFGISKPVASKANTRVGTLTEEHTTLGSPAYMAPEQIRAAKDVDHRSDLWSLGVVLFELLAGTPPFARESLGELFAAILEQQAPRLESVLQTAPPALGDIVARCLERDRARRFQDVLELASDLAPFGPPDAFARVMRIEQTLLNVQLRRDSTRQQAVEPVIVGTSSPNDVTRSGSREIDILERHPAQVTARVTFTSDQPKANAGRDRTTIALWRGSLRKRTLAGVASGAGVAAVLVIAAMIRTSVVAETAARDARDDLAAGAALASPAFVAVVPPQPAQPAQPAQLAPPATPSTPTADAPSGQAAPKAVVHPPVAAPVRRSPAPPKKRPGLLDSPD
jgi:eukaryotic-like serine/threonine-protein kinase